MVIVLSFLGHERSVGWHLASIPYIDSIGTLHCHRCSVGELGHPKELCCQRIDSLFFCKSVRSGLVKYGVFQVHILDHGLVVMKVPFRLQLEKLLHRVSTPPMCHNANRKRCATPMSELCDPLHLRNPSLSTFLGAPS